MPAKVVRLSLLVSFLIPAFAGTLPGQSFLAELKLQHDPAKRSEMALGFADELFDNARSSYVKGEISKGDADLESMTKALNACLDSLATANKSRSYKKAEMKVAYLQRRLSDLVNDMSIQERGWAEFTSRKLDEIHDKLLNGVMRK
jgi:hypothetical protein